MTEADNVEAAFENFEEACRCIVDGSHGIYVPQTFVKKESPTDWHCDEGGLAECWDTVSEGPDNEDYWECWDMILVDAWFEENRDRWTLFQDQDLFMIRDDFDWTTWL